MNIPRKSARTIKGTVGGFESLSNYDVVFTAKTHLDATKSIIEKNATIDGLDVIFELGSSDTDIREGKYSYDVWAIHKTDPEKKFRLGQSTLNIDKSVKY